MENENCLFRRRSGRKYTEDAIPEETLHSILEAGLLAPSGRNKKPVELLVVRGAEELKALSGMRNFGSGMLPAANAAVVVIGRSQDSDTWVEDCSNAMLYMMLRATQLGIANCWVQCRNRVSKEDGVTSPDFVRNLLGIPQEMNPLAVLSLGVSAETLPPHTPEEAEFQRVHNGKF